jgi:hypothetical protein
MKRKDAFRKLRTICQRLDERDPEQFPVVPVRLYPFGSVLTDKPDPSDVDLLFEYQNRPDMAPDDIVTRLAYGKPLPYEQAITQLRRGMQMIRVGLLTDPIEEWVQGRHFSPDTPIRLVWEPGLEWQPIVDELEAHAVAAWDPVAEERHEQIQETFRKIAEEQGRRAAEEWRSKQAW